ncbi:VOC family protein [Ureibacillus manganicus]|uniref:Glyoxalase-like domain-containing protein n=1 Tax=Ureibacillus manganicus DSM 26584 TaxID=1384049 RepID=A0A0A3HXZ3_9BACL|nr:VOC family protein [Ureibacillus manganicus]KGR77279.1 hypothetical protein CD29_15575 [Ureibacillus manganicus DSM 26584]
MAKIIGFDMSSQEPEKAIEFYNNVFGWKISEPNYEYWSVDCGTESEIKGGISRGPADFPHGTRIQIEVDSIDEVIVQCCNNGAKVLREKMEFEKFFLAYLVDPVGIGFGLVEHK